MSLDSGQDRRGCFRDFFSEEGKGTAEVIDNAGSTSMATTSSEKDPSKVVFAEATSRESLQAGLARLEEERTEDTE